MAFNFPNVPSVGQVYTDPVTNTSYEWNGYAWVTAGTGTGVPPVAGDFVLKAGDTMTGPLILSAHPTAGSPVLQAATKQYVDDIVLALTSGNPGEALTTNPTGVPQWGAPIEAGNF